MLQCVVNSQVTNPILKSPRHTSITVCILFIPQNESEEKSRTIEKLQAEVQALQKAIKQHHKGKRHKKQPSPVPTSTSQQPSPSTSPPPSTQHPPYPNPNPTDTSEPSPHHLSNSDLVVPQSQLPLGADAVEESKDVDTELHGSTEPVQTQQEPNSTQDEQTYEPSHDPSLESTKL